MFKQNVESIDGLLKKFLRENSLETPLLQRRVINSYDAVVGQTVAKMSGEKFIKNQTLFVKIKRAALRNDLSMMRTDIVKKLNEAVGAYAISDIKFF